GRERLGPRGDCGARLLGEQPSALRRDRDGHDVVARRIERTGDGDRGLSRDVVLGRATAEEQEDSHAGRHHVTWRTARMPTPMRNNPTSPYQSSRRPRIAWRYW